MLDYNQCIRELRELVYLDLSVSKDTPVNIISEVLDRTGIERCVIKLGPDRVYDYSRNEHKEPEDALRECIHRLETKHGRPHQ